ncbi:MAG TPA: hypothetical protein VF100_03060 [Thermoanaerobaculia bacterium]
MSRGGRLRGFGWRWSHRRFGRTLPIYRPLWVSRAAVAAVAIVGLALAWSVAGRAAFSGVAEPLPPAEAAAVAAAAVADAELPHWVPGEPLPAVERPPFAAPPPPPPWPGSDPTGRLTAEARRREAEGLALLREGHALEAANTLLAAAEAAPGAWSPRYHAGLALLAAEHHEPAARALDEATGALTATGARRWSDPAVAAAETVTLSAASAAAADDCLAAVNRARLAVAALERYRSAADVAVYDRTLPFPVLEAGIDSPHLWNRLADAYRRCDRPYSEYRRRWRQASSFRETEYQAVTEEVRSGPFPAQLGACIEQEDPSLSCWALSNLNKVYARAKILYPRPGKAPSELTRAHAEGLARLAYNAAWLAAQAEDDRPRALDALGRAARLPLGAESEMAARIGALYRHLAPETGDYSFLAGRYAGEDPAALSLAGGRTPEEVKGIAWALSDRWIGLARAGRPGETIAAAEAWRPAAGSFGASLGEWIETVRQRFRADLAAEVRSRRANGDLATAAGLYELETPWLGEAWPPRLAALGAGTLGLWAAIGLGWLALVALAWAVHRLVVVPYLLDTADLYREELQRRHRELRAKGIPFTRDEILDAERHRA